MKLKFTKMHGAGNDFVVIETDDGARDWGRTAAAMCDRHRGIGADGLLLLMPSEVADFRMRIFNADGSEATTCGNGTRCLVKYFVETRKSECPLHKISVETLGGVRDAWFSTADGRVTRVRLAMGSPAFRDTEIPVEVGRTVGRVTSVGSMMEYDFPANGNRLALDVLSLGNPHAVHFSALPVARFPLAEVGPEIEHHAMFPRGVNFEVARVVDGRRIEARVWEHGVGETLACGSGACAIAVAARLHGYIGQRAEIILPGGSLDVEWDGVGQVFLSGPAETVFVGEWPSADGPVEASEPCPQRVIELADASRTR